MTTTRNTKKLKELIYGILSSDATLEALLGSAGRVRQSNVQGLSDYPLVTYSILTEIDNPYNIDQPSNVSRTIIITGCFSTEVGSEQVDALDDRVFELLNGQRLSNSDIQMYSIYRADKKPIPEPDIGVQKIESTYIVDNATI